MKYDHKKIEAKWQKYWLDNKIFKSEVDFSKPKYYVLDMFPYPSGEGLHVGHPEGYTATDILARHKRQKGFNVLHPMGWDSFGLPAEQYAVRTGTHPAISTEKNIKTFKRQLQALGFSYDWDRELATSSPDYYKWTQWIFTKLYERGLAYEAEMLVNYCPFLGTVLANEEVEDGKTKEGGHPVERRPLKQWVLKITAYADRLLADLDLLDWPEGLKKLQVNWIGRSEGATIRFPVENSSEFVEIFTTCPDTLFGATYMVLAPEHPLVSKIVTEKEREAVLHYKKVTATKSDFDRTEMNKEKTGVFTGGYCINPVNQKKIPIWISDYVLMGYGTGAIMAVPAHDERDFEFAKAYQLPIIQVIKSDEACFLGEGEYINSHHETLSLNGVTTKKEAVQKVISWLEKKGLGKRTVSYKLRDWLFSRQRYWAEPFPILHFEDGSQRALEEDELPLLPPPVEDYRPTGDGKSPLSKVKEWVEIIDPKTGRKALRETNTMPQWAGSCWYYLRFLDPKNEKEAFSKEKENYWMPVDLYVGGVEHAVLHLLYARFWHKVLYDCGLVSTKEPFTKLRNQGLIVARSYQKTGGGYVSPKDVREENGVYYTKEGEVLKSQIEKMSKSKLNGVTPDDVVDEFGADALRLYEMFMGPLDKEKVWNTDAVSGCFRFLNRFYDMCFSPKVTNETPSLLHKKLGARLSFQVGEDIEAMQFNTAIARMMEFINEFTKLESYPKEILKMAIQALMPFAPHLAEEAWEHLGFKESLSYCPYPQIDKELLIESEVTYVVQVNGKLRARFEAAADLEEITVLEMARSLPQIKQHLEGKEGGKTIFVKNKLVNFVF
jgi:leucyl-tRNA synthetase